MTEHYQQTVGSVRTPQGTRKGLEFKLTLINFTNKYKVTTNMQASVIGVGMFPLEYKKNN